MAELTMEQILDELYSGPLENFVARRDEHAKALKVAGRSEEASAVKKLRKPSVTAWAVNQVHFERGEGLAELVHLTKTLRQALAEGDAALASKLTLLKRQLTSQLVEEAKGFLLARGYGQGQAALRAIEGSFDALAAGQQSQQLGRLERDLKPPGFDALSPFLTLVKPAVESAPGAAERKAKKNTAQVNEKRAALKRKEAELTKKLAELCRERTKAEEAVAKAEAAQAEARQTVDRLTFELRESRVRLDAARKAVAESQSMIQGCERAVVACERELGKLRSE